MQQLILILHVLVAVMIIASVLLQHGRGADVGATFGSGSSNTMFGSTGALPFLMKVTAICAVIFFGTSLSLSYLTVRAAKQSQLLAMPVTLTTTPVNKTNLITMPTTTTTDEGLSFTPKSKK